MRLWIALLVGALLVPPACAQEYVWVRANGPDGGDCRAIAFDPDDSARVLAGFYRGVHLSGDGGASWLSAPTGQFLAMGFAFDPVDSRTVYAAAKSPVDALQKSTDCGSTWAEVRIMPADPQPVVLCVAVDPSDRQRIYAGVQSGGICRSTDAGATWSPANAGIAAVSVSSIIVDLSDPTRLVACGHGGVFASSDGGDSWFPASAGIPTPDIRALAASPGDSNALYAATASGICRTTDGCATWSLAGLAGVSVNSVAIDTSDGGVVFAGTPSGVFRSSDGGLTWQQQLSGMEKQAYVQAIAVSPHNSAEVIAGTGGSVYRSRDGGRTWAISPSGVRGMRCQALGATAASPGTVIVGCGTGLLGAGVYRSNDWGMTWQLLGVGNEYVDTIACSPASGDLLFATSGNGIFRTTDGGTAWDLTQVGGRFYGLCTDPMDPAVFYGGTNGSGVWRTRNAGGSWEKCSSGLDWGLVRSLAIDAGSPARLYAGVDAIYPKQGVYRTADGGDNWSPAASGLEAVRVWSVAVDPIDGRVYAGSYNRGLFISTDAGVSFAQAGSGLSGTIPCLAVDSISRHVYAGTWDGVYRSTDLGATFVKLAGFGQLALSLCVDPNNHGFLYAGTDGDRVWRCSFRIDAPGIAAAKAYPDGQLVRIAGLSVSAAFAGRFYIRDGAASGIAVVSDAAVSEGDAVTVTGTLRTTNGEREIVAASVAGF